MHLVKNKSYYYDIISLSKSMEKKLNHKYYSVPKPDSGIKHNNSCGSITSNTLSILKSNTNNFGMPHVTMESELLGCYSNWSDDQHLIPDRGKRVFSIPQHQDQLWGPPRILYNEYRRLFHWG
jgi:hypothetical protein